MLNFPFEKCDSPTSHDLDLLFSRLLIYFCIIWLRREWSRLCLVHVPWTHSWSRDLVESICGCYHILHQKGTHFFMSYWYSSGSHYGHHFSLPTCISFLSPILKCSPRPLAFSFLLFLLLYNWRKGVNFLAVLSMSNGIIASAFFFFWNPREIKLKAPTKSWTRGWRHVFLFRHFCLYILPSSCRSCLGCCSFNSFPLSVYAVDDHGYLMNLCDVSAIFKRVCRFKERLRVTISAWRT